MRLGHDVAMETDEVLESGYGPGAPRGDNLLNDFVQGEAEAFAELGNARGDRIEHDDEFALTMTDGGSPTLFGNVVVLRRPLLEHEWPAAARRMHEFFAGHPGGGFMTFSGWPTPDVRELGFGAVGHPPLMLRPPGPVPAPLPDGFEVRAVTDGETAAQYERTLILGYPVPEVDPDATGSFISSDPDAAPRWRHFLGVLDGAAVATGSAFVDDASRARRVHLHARRRARPGRGLRDHRRRDARRSRAAGTADRQRSRQARLRPSRLPHDRTLHVVGRPPRS